MKTFREIAFNENIETHYKTFIEFLDYLTDYMDLYVKEDIDKIITLGRKLDLFEKRKKCFRVTCMKEGKPGLGNFDLVSTSTSKLTGKVLKGVVEDMEDRFLLHDKTCDEKVYIEIENAIGIDIVKLLKYIIKNKGSFGENEDYYVDVFNRLKKEKEFLVINKDIKIKHIEHIESIENI